MTTLATGLHASHRVSRLCAFTLAHFVRPLSTLGSYAGFKVPEVLHHSQVSQIQANLRSRGSTSVAHLDLTEGAGLVVFDDAAVIYRPHRDDQKRDSQNGIEFWPYDAQQSLQSNLRYPGQRDQLRLPSVMSPQKIKIAFARILKLSSQPSDLFSRVKRGLIPLRTLKYFDLNESEFSALRSALKSPDQESLMFWEGVVPFLLSSSATRQQTKERARFVFSRKDMATLGLLLTTVLNGLTIPEGPTLWVSQKLINAGLIEQNPDFYSSYFGQPLGPMPYMVTRPLDWRLDAIQNDTALRVLKMSALATSDPYEPREWYDRGSGETHAWITKGDVWTWHFGLTELKNNLSDPRRVDEFFDRLVQSKLEYQDIGSLNPADGRSSQPIAFVQNSVLSPIIPETSKFFWRSDLRTNFLIVKEILNDPRVSAHPDHRKWLLKVMATTPDWLTLLERSNFTGYVYPSIPSLDWSKISDKPLDSQEVDLLRQAVAKRLELISAHPFGDSKQYLRAWMIAASETSQLLSLTRGQRIESPELDQDLVQFLNQTKPVKNLMPYNSEYVWGRLVMDAFQQIVPVLGQQPEGVRLKIFETYLDSFVTKDPSRSPSGTTHELVLRLSTLEPSSKARLIELAAKKIIDASQGKVPDPSLFRHLAVLGDNLFLLSPQTKQELLSVLKTVDYGNHYWDNPFYPILVHLDADGLRFVLNHYHSYAVALASLPKDDAFSRDHILLPAMRDIRLSLNSIVLKPDDAARLKNIEFQLLESLESQGHDSSEFKKILEIK